MAAETVKCPHCGLAVTIDSTATGKPTLKYDLDEWRRLCKLPHLRSPALCFVTRNGPGTPKQE